MKKGYQDGVGFNVKFDGIRGLAVGAEGAIYVADFGNDFIRKISLTGQTTTFAGRPPQGANDEKRSIMKFSGPNGIIRD
jgi:hypothetical protein